LLVGESPTYTATPFILLYFSVHSIFLSFFPHLLYCLENIIFSFFPSSRVPKSAIACPWFEVIQHHRRCCPFVPHLLLVSPPLQATNRHHRTSQPTTTAFRPVADRTDKVEADSLERHSSA
jgi:hypothetical protein